MRAFLQAIVSTTLYFRVRTFLVATIVCTGCVAISPSQFGHQPFVFQVQVESRRQIDVRGWLPQKVCDPCDVIIFSHGHGLSFDQYDALLKDWAEAGYVTLAPQHVDSEHHPDRNRYSSADYLGLRIEDFKAVASRIVNETDSAIAGVRLSGRFVAAGHSFGALIAQMAGGATVERNETTVELIPERNPLGVIAISPPGPVDGYLSAQGWNKIHVPHFVATGTKDVVPMFAPTWQAHLESFHAGPVGSSYALTFVGMDHYFNGAFGRLQSTGSDATKAIADLNNAAVQFFRARSVGRIPSAEEWASMRSQHLRTETR